ncbi:MAG: MBL fold metallo-hydrolase [Bacteroidales bacterium]|nr:MBL fold metallo-hydrolase [Bacteroidales bacterium]
MSLIISLILTLLPVIKAPAATVGAPLPGWQEGMLDIHAINTGRGECTFFIYPDGTTLLVDAGDLFGYDPEKYAPVLPRPSEDIEPWQVYAEYIRHFMPAGRKKLDYCVLTHFHIDHIAYIGECREIHPKGGYALAGPMGLYSLVPFDMIIDRSAPDYPDYKENSCTDHYIRFTKYNEKHSGLRVERFAVGSDSQLAPKYKPEACPGFSVFGYAASGMVWNGSEIVDTKARYENGMSCAFLMSYGKFDYFTSGDMNQKNTCNEVAKSIGRKIEAMKAHHHMSNEAPYAVEAAVYQPKVVVTQSFYERDIQPNQNIIKEFSGSQDMFFTNLPMTLVNASPDIYKDCKCLGGHIVIRVSPDGDFFVYVLDDTDSEYKVKSIHGPYKSE